MSGAIPLFPQYAFMEWCSVKKEAQGQLYFYLSSSSNVSQFSSHISNSLPFLLFSRFLHRFLFCFSIISTLLKLVPFSTCLFVTLSTPFPYVSYPVSLSPSFPILHLGLLCDVSKTFSFVCLFKHLRCSNPQNGVLRK
jgi:hypothetical protein